MKENDYFLPKSNGSQSRPVEKDSSGEKKYCQKCCTCKCCCIACVVVIVVVGALILAGYLVMKGKMTGSASSEDSGQWDSFLSGDDNARSAEISGPEALSGV